MKIGVITFPGSNCDRDTIFALQFLGHEVVNLWHKDSFLAECNALVIPGGFSYGDYLRTGAIARFSPIMKSVMAFAEDGGKVLGICNGFQILTECGLLPGVLMRNTVGYFIAKDIYVSIEHQTNQPSKALRIPIAHGEGNYYVDSETLAKIEENKQVFLRYCSSLGTIDAISNPNGSLNNIAGVCNPQRNVFGMMPHPERATFPVSGNIDGQTIFNLILLN